MLDWTPEWVANSGECFLRRNVLGPADKAASQIFRIGDYGVGMLLGCIPFRKCLLGFSFVPAFDLS